MKINFLGNWTHHRCERCYIQFVTLNVQQHLRVLPWCCAITPLKKHLQNDKSRVILHDEKNEAVNFQCQTHLPFEEVITEVWLWMSVTCLPCHTCLVASYLNRQFSALSLLHFIVSCTLKFVLWWILIVWQNFSYKNNFISITHSGSNGRIDGVKRIRILTKLVCCIHF